MNTTVVKTRLAIVNGEIVRTQFAHKRLGPQRFLRVIMRLKVVENLSKLMHCFGSQSAMLGENAPFCEFLRV